MPRDTEAPFDPYNIENYLVKSSEGPPFEQDLGQAPFIDLHGEDIWPALAIMDDGGVHPCKVNVHIYSSLLLSMACADDRLHHI